jgi:hypothetical protein
MKMFHKPAMVGLAFAALSGQASAINYYYEFNDLNPLVIGTTYTSSTISHVPGDSFTDALGFNVPAADLVAKIISFEVGVQTTFGNLTGALYRGVDANSYPASCKPGCNNVGYQFVTNLGGGSNSWTSAPVSLSLPGYYFIVIAGQTQIANSIGGSYVGQITLSTISAIPEASTWSMWIAGLGVVGLVVRRKLQSKSVSA